MVPYQILPSNIHHYHFHSDRTYKRIFLITLTIEQHIRSLKIEQQECVMNGVTNLNPRKWQVDKRRSKRKRILETKPTAIKRKILLDVGLIPILLRSGAKPGKRGSLGTWDREGRHWRETQKEEGWKRFLVLTNLWKWGNGYWRFGDFFFLFWGSEWYIEWGKMGGIEKEIKKKWRWDPRKKIKMEIWGLGFGFRMALEEFR